MMQQVPGISLPDKAPINELVTKSDYRNIKERMLTSCHSTYLSGQQSVAIKAGLLIRELI